eukprot:m.130001 g.130001  ORF g.130001 m.130001 type:complete len:417 (+) comp16774_c0_seq3:239-1489(+)
MWLRTARRRPPGSHPLRRILALMRPPPCPGRSGPLPSTLPTSSLELQQFDVDSDGSLTVSELISAVRRQAQQHKEKAFLKRLVYVLAAMALVICLTTFGLTWTVVDMNKDSSVSDGGVMKTKSGSSHIATDSLEAEGLSLAYAFYQPDLLSRATHIELKFEFNGTAYGLETVETINGDGDNEELNATLPMYTVSRVIEAYDIPASGGIVIFTTRGETITLDSIAQGQADLKIEGVTDMVTIEFCPLGESGGIKNIAEDEVESIMEEYQTQMDADYNKLVEETPDLKCQRDNGVDDEAAELDRRIRRSGSSSGPPRCKAPPSFRAACSRFNNLVRERKAKFLHPSLVFGCRQFTLCARKNVAFLASYHCRNNNVGACRYYRGLVQRYHQAVILWQRVVPGYQYYNSARYAWLSQRVG